jgi:moderate conductance mechanosensitive channel
MDASNQPTLLEQAFRHFSGHDSSAYLRLGCIIVLAGLLHLAVMAIRRFSEWLINKNRAETHPLGFVVRQPKLVTLIQLITHGITFVMYFFALGLVLEELRVNLKGYLASASIVALAISFGSQGLVQDVVISLTLIFSDAMDLGEMVEIFGATSVIGRVEEIGLRFTLVRNLYNQVVFIPNRTIANVSRFPHGGVYAYADVQLPPDTDQAKASRVVENIARGVWSQFEAIILLEPTISPVQTALGAQWNFVRVHFLIWPGQGSLIETTFRQQIIMAMKVFQPSYADWQVPVTYRALPNSHKA